MSSDTPTPAFSIVPDDKIQAALDARNAWLDKAGEDTFDESKAMSLAIRNIVIAQQSAPSVEDGTQVSVPKKEFDEMFRRLAIYFGTTAGGDYVVLSDSAAGPPAKAINAFLNAMDVSARPSTSPVAPAFDLVAVLKRQREWSFRTFGDGQRSEGNVKHIEKELKEIRACPSDLEEWIDVAMLSFDGGMRQRFTPEEVAAAYLAKLEKNEARTWVVRDDGEPSEHDRSEEAAPTPPVEEHPPQIPHEGKTYCLKAQGSGLYSANWTDEGDCVVRTLRGDVIVPEETFHGSWWAAHAECGSAVYRERYEAEDQQPAPPADPDLLKILTHLTSGLRNVLPGLGLKAQQIRSQEIWEMGGRIEALIEQAENAAYPNPAAVVTQEDERCD